MNAISISDVAIRQTSDNLYSLNDLHKASGGRETHKPNNWLRSQQAQELIAEIQAEGKVAVQTSQGGNNRGTYVCRELVYAYATWISAKFFLQVIRTFDALVSASPYRAKLPPRLQYFQDTESIEVSEEEYNMLWRWRKYHEERLSSNEVATVRFMVRRWVEKEKPRGLDYQQAYGKLAEFTGRHNVEELPKSELSRVMKWLDLKTGGIQKRLQDRCLNDLPQHKILTVKLLPPLKHQDRSIGSLLLGYGAGEAGQADAETALQYMADIQSTFANLTYAAAAYRQLDAKSLLEIKNANDCLSALSSMVMEASANVLKH